RRSIARSRRSIEIGLAIACASIAALTGLNQITAENGIPFRFNVMSFCSRLLPMHQSSQFGER
ncbi:MAG: hypothetical protein OXF74_05695, partial [Rhodobacteraceae bacterium]|nr:hypothetical protein [Paracoccaceae bacterium]